MPPKGKTAVRLSHVIVPEGGHRGGKKERVLRTSIPRPVSCKAGGRGEGVGDALGQHPWSLSGS